MQNNLRLGLQNLICLESGTEMRKIMYKKDIMLITDDLEINRDILKEMFKENFDIIEAENGKQCIELVKQYGSLIKIILLDIVMPVMTGIEVLKYRSENVIFSEIPVIIITITDELENQMTALHLGATDYITKPFTSDIVIHRINNVLSSKRRIEEIAKEKESLQVKSELDLMTNLYNKMTTQHLISSKLVHNDTLNALFVIDIDNFKQVNDLKGHLVGDHTIRIIADLISGHFRKKDVIGRIGGDEFAVFMTDLPCASLARQKAEKLTTMLRYKPNLTSPANVSISVGLALTDSEPCTYEELFSKADHALYCAKQNGKGQYAEYGLPTKKEIFHFPDGIALLLSDELTIYNTIDAILNNNLLVKTVSFHQIMNKQTLEQTMTIKNIKILYVDISLEKDNGRAALKKLQSCHYLSHIPVIVICREGNLIQYKNAIKANALDIIFNPIDIAFAKRRIISVFQKTYKTV